MHASPLEYFLGEEAVVLIVFLPVRYAQDAPTPYCGVYIHVNARLHHLSSNIAWPVQQIMVGMVLASTNPAPPRLRGKLSGLFLMSQSLGRTIGPVTWGLMYAWSISPSGGGRLPFIDHRFIFTLSAILTAFVAALGCRVLTEESMTHVAEEPSGLPPSPLDNVGELLSQPGTPHGLTWEAVSAVTPRGRPAWNVNSDDSMDSNTDLEPVVVKDGKAILV